MKARTINNGQSCIAAKRFIVADSIYEEFERRFVESMQALKVGDPMAPDTDVGPLATSAIREELHAQVERAVAAGARVLLGGHMIDGPGYFYEPTVLAGVPRQSDVFREELFGPVAMLFRGEGRRGSHRSGQRFALRAGRERLDRATQPSRRGSSMKSRRARFS